MGYYFLLLSYFFKKWRNDLPTILYYCLQGFSHKLDGKEILVILKKQHLNRAMFENKCKNYVKVSNKQKLVQNLITQ